MTLSDEYSRTLIEMNNGELLAAYYDSKIELANRIDLNRGRSFTSAYITPLGYAINTDSLESVRYLNRNLTPNELLMKTARSSTDPNDPTNTIGALYLDQLLNSPNAAIYDREILQSCLEIKNVSLIAKRLIREKINEIDYA